MIVVTSAVTDTNAITKGIAEVLPLPCGLLHTGIRSDPPMGWDIAVPVGGTTVACTRSVVAGRPGRISAALAGDAGVVAVK